MVSTYGSASCERECLRYGGRQSVSRDPDRAALARGSEGGFGDGDLKLPRFRRVVLDLGDYGSVVTASIAAS